MKTLLLLLAAPALGRAPLFEFFDAHPLPDPDAPWCVDEGLHFHSYALDEEQEAVYVVDGVIHYVGDSVVRGAPMEAVWYWDAHPIGHLGGAWCVLDGPHAHHWRPWWRYGGYSSSLWMSEDGYYVYAGAWDDWYLWSYRRYYDRQASFHVRLVTSPRYAPLYRSVRHPAVVYRSDRYVRPTWSRRSDAERYRVSRREVEIRRPSYRYERSPSPVRDRTYDRVLSSRSSREDEERRRLERSRSTGGSRGSSGRDPRSRNR